MDPPHFFKIETSTNKERSSSLNLNSLKNCKQLTEEEELTLEKNLVWVFASPRSGTTWLVTQLLTYNTCQMDEPYIGNHLSGPFNIETLSSQPVEDYGRHPVLKEHKNRPDYFYSDKFDLSWKFLTRKYILNRIYFQFKELNKKIVIKEPNGLAGAESLMECLPKSKIIIVLRDGRDILDSLLDARTQGGWLANKGPTIPREQRIQFLTRESKFWITRMKILKRIYQNRHKDLVHFVRYEDLRKNTFEELQKIYKFLEINIEPHRISIRVEKFSFENIPDDQKGKGKPRRSATPGKWKENFTGEEQRIVGKIMEKILRELGYE